MLKWATCLDVGLVLIFSSNSLAKSEYACLLHYMLPKISTFKDLLEE